MGDIRAINQSTVDLLFSRYAQTYEMFERHEQMVDIVMARTAMPE